MNALTKIPCMASNYLTLGLNGSSHIALLITRFYLAYVFLESGLAKLRSWDATVYLFSHDFHVVGMSPETAAYLGTAAELILPIFLVLGVGARLPIVLLFIFNAVSVISYPYLLTPDGACALKDHVLWGVLIAALMFFSYGKISLDNIIQKKICPNYLY